MLEIYNSIIQKINWKPLKQFFKGLFAVLVGIVTFIAGAFWGLISLAFSLTKKK